jgi:hypothetical protein
LRRGGERQLRAETESMRIEAERERERRLELERRLQELEQKRQQRGSEGEAWGRHGSPLQIRLHFGSPARSEPADGAFVHQG